MKHSFSTLLGALAISLATLVPSTVRAAHASGASKLTVNFPNWQKYTDIKDHDMPTEKGQLGILDNLKRELEGFARYDVPDGDHLTMTFSDIDLAGDFEPWRGPNWDDVRMVKSIYPPRFKFTWQLTDASGQVVKQGSENLLDMNFDMRITLDQTDPLRYEKDMLRDWMNGKIRR